MYYKNERGKIMYTNVGIPRDLMEQVEQIISTSRLGYRTRSEFIIEAVREKIEKTAKKQEVAH